MTENQRTWSLPIEGVHEVSASAASLSFVGGAGDFDNRGEIRSPDDLGSQIKGAVENVEKALSQENCSLADVVRIKAFVELSPQVDEGGAVRMLLDALPGDPAAVISVVPVEMQPFEGQKIQLQAIAKRDWRELAYQVVEDTLRIASADTGEETVVTTALRVGEFIAAANRTAAHCIDAYDGSIDGVDQCHAIMKSLNSDLKQVGATLQDSVKLEGYYQGVTRAQWTPFAKARASYFAEPGPPATVIPCHLGEHDQTMTRVGVLAMRERRNSYDKYIPREDAWPERVWDWPAELPYRQAQRLRDMIWLGGQVPAQPYSNTGKRVHPGQLLPQARLTMSYISDLLRPFGRSPSDLKLLVCYYRRLPDQDETDALLSLLTDYCGGVLPPLSLIPVDHMQDEDSTIEIWGVAQG
jgi:enamine deaminase RidA (YjgF/YER057c/UK114 family)